MREDVLFNNRAGGWGLISPLKLQIFKSNIFQSNFLKSNTFQSNIFTGKSSNRTSTKDTSSYRRCAICKSSKRWRSQHLRICFDTTPDLGRYVSKFVLFMGVFSLISGFFDFCSILSCCGCFVTKCNVSIVLTLLSCSCGLFERLEIFFSFFLSDRFFKKTKIELFPLVAGSLCLIHASICRRRTCAHTRRNSQQLERIPLHIYVVYIMFSVVSSVVLSGFDS